MIRYFAFLVIFISWVVYFSNFNPLNGFPIDKSEWGTFGDFVGGVTNPILTFFTMLMLIKSINLQKDANDSIIKQNTHMHEVSERQKEMDDLRSFESSFYSLAEVSRKEFDALKIIGRNKKFYIAADAVVYLEGYMISSCRYQNAEALRSQFSRFDTDSCMAIFSAVRSFYILFKFTNESCPEKYKDRYYEIANYIMPIKFLHLVCLAYVFGDWKISKDFEKYGFFERKGLEQYVIEFKKVRDFY
ncbi:hypothetical protein QLY38_03650 [Cronobacter sakazakii]|uniref:hypothetical protein n=1 Tax=Cronobacter sakazakii TaxID=28141 RepID=UPI000CFE14BD|nr:hypothetical protein [Cronobacter sakazakii]KAB0807507.1 hypothetical protein FZI41_20530 [Cronobacter sakazakii]MCU7759146.1 hypothetical protein [Cronobacter sakazakii]MDI7262897.1 hypothetical protein [Cronobacter sakazakii]MDI7280084.1 hypothetical protein [Cronobacter sakazakii]MDI7285899.1 hypothetical protein [Cronobacter sakazakii]